MNTGTPHLHSDDLLKVSCGGQVDAAEGGKVGGFPRAGYRVEKAVGCGGGRGSQRTPGGSTRPGKGFGSFFFLPAVNNSVGAMRVAVQE